MSEVLHQLAERTNGDIYIGVVGPVRVGKSTFVKKVMETVVLPHIIEEDERKRALDELPQSSPGLVIMTSEPKFVPANAAQISLGSNPFPVNVRLVDCVGYVIDGVKGHEDENGPKFVHTPWHHEPVPFQEAAKMGTDRVIRDHATIGIVITTDGTVNGIARHAAEKAEQAITDQLQQIGKPYVIILNSAYPTRADTLQLRNDLIQRYNVPVIAIAVDKLTAHDIYTILNEALFEFPLEQVEVERPQWVDVLDLDHPYRLELQQVVEEYVTPMLKIRDLEQIALKCHELEFIEQSQIERVDAGLGIGIIRVDFTQVAFQNVCNEFLEQPLTTKKDWLLFIKEARQAKQVHRRFQEAISQAQHEGYGVTMPSMDEFTPTKPELTKENNFYGVKMRAKAPSYHILRIDMEAEFSPLLGAQFHAEHLLRELEHNYANDHQALWQTPLFGTPLYEVLIESLNFKMNRLPLSSKKILRKTVERMVNEEERGLVTFII